MALLAEKELEDITVTELAERADINRKTFYAHYRFPEDVVAEIEERWFSELETAIVGLSLAEVVEDPSALLVAVQRRYEELSAPLRHALAAGRNQRLFHRVADDAKRRILANLRQEGADMRQARVVVEFAISGLMATLRQWNEFDNGMQLDELLAIDQRLLAEGVLGSIDKRATLPPMRDNGR